MEDVRSTFGLNPRQFEQALAILQRERQAHTPSLWQEITFKVLNFAIYGLGIGFTILFLHAFLFSMILASKVKFISISFSVSLYVILASIVFLFLSGITVLFFLNLPYLRQFLRENKLIRQLGLMDALRAPWKTERRKKRLRDAMDLGVRILGLLTSCGMLIVAIEDVLNNRIDWMSFLLSFMFIAFLGAIIVTYFMRRNKERLELVSHLYSSLEGYKEKPGQGEDIRISREAYEKIAEIERAQISAQRVQSILKGGDEAGGSYFLQKSRELQEAQAKLDVTTRLRVENQIDDLMTEPRPSGVTKDSEAGIFHIHVPETSVTISYIVDDQTRRIQILSIESSSGDVESPSEFTG